MTLIIGIVVCVSRYCLHSLQLTSGYTSVTTLSLGALMRWLRHEWGMSKQCLLIIFAPGLERYWLIGLRPRSPQPCGLIFHTFSFKWLPKMFSLILNRKLQFWFRLKEFNPKRNSLNGNKKKIYFYFRLTEHRRLVKFSILLWNIQLIYKLWKKRSAFNAV